MYFSACDSTQMSPGPEEKNGIPFFTTGQYSIRDPGLSGLRPTWHPDWLGSQCSIKSIPALLASLHSEAACVHEQSGNWVL